MPTQAQKRELRCKLLRKKLGKQPIQAFRNHAKELRQILEEQIAAEQELLINTLYALAPKSLVEFLKLRSIVEDLIGRGDFYGFEISAEQIHCWHFKNFNQFFATVRELKKNWEGIIQVTIRQRRRTIEFKL
jgi:hypothetical protein